jgi:hypothetical protein
MTPRTPRRAPRNSGIKKWKSESGSGDVYASSPDTMCRQLFPLKSPQSAISMVALPNAAIGERHPVGFLSVRNQPAEHI